MEVDHNNENGLFWITGSQIYPLMKGIQESLAGRVMLFRLYGFSQSEIKKEYSEVFPDDLPLYLSAHRDAPGKDVYDRIFEGSFPRVLTQEFVEPEGFYSSYVQTCLDRDVREIINIMDVGKFLQFLSLSAARTAQELNLAGFARDLQIDNTTAKRWMGVLEALGIIISLRPYSGNLGKRIVKRPKMYFMDTGLACFLCGIERAEDLEKSPMAGALFETWVVSEVLKTWWNHGKQPRVFYYRDARQKEIDLVIERKGRLYPFEIKLSRSPSHAFRNFDVVRALKKPVEFGGVIYAGREMVPVDERYWMIPADFI